MKKLKLTLCLSFVLLFIGAELYSSDTVTGRAGGASLVAPTNLIASKNTYNSKIGLYWDTLRGATNYRIFRNTVNNTATATDVGTTAANSFFDTTATAGQTLFYWVRGENASSVGDFSVADTGIRSATANQGPLPPLNPPPSPPENPVTATKAYLGKTLFWDEQLSSTRTVSCGTCHHSSSGGIDPRGGAANSLNPGPDGLLNTADDIRGSFGVPANNLDGTYTSIATFGLNAQVTGRKTVSYVNAAYAPILFWDGRATGTFRDPITNSILINNGGALESQVLGPPLSTAEMGHSGRDWNDVASRVSASKPLALSPSIPAPLATWINGRTYAELFQEAFGTAEVTPARIALAIGTFERTLYSDRAPVDLDAAGITPLTGAEQRGRNIFAGPGTNCAVCHAGNLFTDNSFRYIGVRPQNDDTGRFQVTGNANNTGEFRVPSLRNVGLRGSYFHNGQFTTLEQVVAFYNRGGDFNGPNKPNNLIRPLGLNAQQQSDLVAFLRNSLTDPRVASETERFDRPTLYTESNRVPVITGTGRAGSGGFTPQIKAISPPILGNPNFTVSVSGAVGNANAVLVIDSVDPGIGTTVPASGSFARVTSTTQNTGNGNGWASVNIAIPNGPALVGQTFFARWYIGDAGAAGGLSVSQAAKFTVFGDAAAVTRAKFVDFDGDGKTDISVYRPSEGNWYYLNSSNNSFTALHFGNATDRVTPADFDGDGKTDVAVYRDGTWYELRSTGAVVVASFGLPGDIAQPGDFDGDNKADIAIFRPSDGNWWWQSSVDGIQRATRWGISTDIPTAADFDGDGKTDLAVYRNGTWYINKSSGGTSITQFGLADDKPVVGDYDGDGKADIAVFRPSTGVWYSLRSSDGGFRATAFGLTTDVPSPGDYDGDGTNDLAVYRDGIWYLQRSTTGFSAQQFGLTGDKPVPSSYVP